MTRCAVCGFCACDDRARCAEDARLDMDLLILACSKERIEDHRVVDPDKALAGMLHVAGTLLDWYRET